jgi:hypothetical protein
MKRTAPGFAVFLLVLGGVTGAFAQKPGGILQLQHFDSPASMSILEEATRAREQPVRTASPRWCPIWRPSGSGARTARN